MTLVAKLSWPEGTAAIVSALAAMIGLTAIARSGSVHYRFHLDWLRPLARVPYNVLRDSLLVLREAWRLLLGGHSRAHVVKVRFEPGNASPTSAMRRALIVGAISASPNTIVVDVDSQRGTMLVHQMVPTPVPGASVPAEATWPL